MLGILHSASVIGIKRTAFRGKEKIDDMHTHISKITAGVEKLQSKYVVLEYNRRRGEALLRLTHTYSRERTEETKELFVNVLPQDHVPSAKEQKEGVDTAAIMDGKLQLGKLHKKGENFALLQVELSGRLVSKYGRALTEDEKAAIEKLGIQELKNQIKDNETARHAENGDIIQGSFDVRFFKPLFTECHHYIFNLV